MWRELKKAGKENKPVKTDWEKKLKEIKREFEVRVEESKKEKEKKKNEKKEIVNLARCHQCLDIFQLPSNRAPCKRWECWHMYCHKCMHILASMGEFRCPTDHLLLPGYDKGQICLNNMLTEYMDVNDAETNP